MAACEDSISNNAASVTSTNTSRIGENLAPFNPSMQPVVSTALELLQLKADDVLYELGCGDGRVMVAAALATPGLKCVGVEYDEEYANRAKAAVDAAGLGSRVTVLHANVLDVDMSAATCAFVYLVPKGMQLIASNLQKLAAKEQCRVVSYVFSVPNLTPSRVETHKSTKIYLYKTSEARKDDDSRENVTEKAT